MSENGSDIPEVSSISNTANFQKTTRTHNEMAPTSGCPGGLPFRVIVRDSADLSTEMKCNNSKGTT